MISLLYVEVVPSSLALIEVIHAQLNLVLFTILSFKRGNANKNINFCFQEDKEGTFDVIVIK